MKTVKIFAAIVKSKHENETVLHPIFIGHLNVKYMLNN